MALVALAVASRLDAATDAAGRQVHLTNPPQRIVALTPSAVETLFAIGAGPAVVGRGASAAPLELPVGSGLALVGAPYFLYLLRRGGRWQSPGAW